MPIEVEHCQKQFREGMEKKLNEKKTNTYYAWPSISDVRTKVMNNNKTSLKTDPPVIAISHSTAKNNKTDLSDVVDEATKRKRRIVLSLNTIAIVVCMSLLVNRSSICINR